MMTGPEPVVAEPKYVCTRFHGEPTAWDLTVVR